MKNSLFLVTMLMLVGATQAWAGGYEKNILWSARTAGIGGAAASTVSGADALYFNPAGMVMDKASKQVSANFSPTWATFKGSVVADNVSDTNTQFFPIASVLYSQMINDQLALGAGYYVSGGSKSEFASETFTPTSGAAFGITPKDMASIQITEFSVGAAYKVMPGLKLGAAWRLAMVKAEFASAGLVPGSGTTLLASDYHDLKDTSYSGYRLGAQYAPQKNWGVGAEFRSEMKFAAKGTQDVQEYSNATALAASGGDITLTTTFPLQLNLGGHYDYSDIVRFYGEYGFTQYSKNAEVQVDGSYTATGLGTQVNRNIQQRWANQHNFRVGAECKSFDWPIRVGYVLTLEPENKNYALPTLSAPGTGHTFSVGTGHSFMNEQLDFNTALVYDFVSSDVPSNTSNIPTIFAGTQSTTAVSAHFSLAYNF
jgi:long-subunit fatty acid transport protein